MVVTETKQSLVTSAGDAILGVLAPDNPLVSLVIKAARVGAYSIPLGVTDLQVH